MGRLFRAFPTSGCARVAAAVTCALYAAVVVAAQQSPKSPSKPTTISGIVIDAASGTPLPRCVVTISGVDGRERRTVVTDPQGGFVFNGPQGTMMLAASKAGYSGGYHGQKFPLGPHQDLEVAEGQSVTGITLSLWKNAVVSGVVRDESGEPIVNALVRSLRLEAVAGRNHLRAARNAKTDDRGMYRIADLIPGRYLIALPASGPRTPPTTVSSEEGYATIYYPAAPTVAAAAVLELKAGDERVGIDFDRASVNLVTLRGAVTGYPADRTRPVQVRLVPAEDSDFQSDLEAMRTTAATDGRFSFSHVPPGSYVLSVVVFPVEPSQPGTTRMMQLGNGSSFGGAAPGGRSPLPPSPEQPTLWGEVSLSVGDKNVDRIVIALRPGLRISGRVRFEGATSPPAASQLMATPVAITIADGRELNGLPLSGLDAHGAFRTAGLPPGKYLPRPMVSVRGWHLKSIHLDGRDVSTEAISLEDGDVSGVTITFVDRPAELSGTVRDSSGKLRPDATVYVFPTDRSGWVDFGPLPLRLRQTRVGTSGAYRFPSLLPGDYYVMATLAAYEIWQCPEKLEPLSAAARKVHVEAGQRSVQDLTAR